MPTTTDLILTSTPELTSPPNMTDLPCRPEPVRFGGKMFPRVKFSTPINGSQTDLNPNNNGISFLPESPSTPITMLLKLNKQYRILELAKIEIPRPSSVDRFQVTFLDRNRKRVGSFRILSTDGRNSSLSPLINRFPMKKKLWKKVRYLKVQILDTSNGKAPVKVTLILKGCFEKKPQPGKYFSQSIMFPCRIFEKMLFFDRTMHRN